MLYLTVDIMSQLEVQLSYVNKARGSMDRDRFCLYFTFADDIELDVHALFIQDTRLHFAGNWDGFATKPGPVLRQYWATYSEEAVVEYTLRYK